MKAFAATAKPGRSAGQGRATAAKPARVRSQAKAVAVAVKKAPPPQPTKAPTQPTKATAANRPPAKKPTASATAELAARPSRKAAAATAASANQAKARRAGTRPAGPGAAAPHSATPAEPSVPQASAAPAEAPPAPAPSAERKAGTQTPPQDASPARAGASARRAEPGRRPPGMPPGPPVLTPRMPAKAEVFHEGDPVVYPTHGVGRVERIAIEEIAGHKLELIHITFDENRMTLRVPVAKARSAGLRKLSTRKQFDQAMTVLKGKARIKRTMWSRRAQEYEAKINSGDPLAIAEVVRDLRRNAGQPDQSFSERQIYESAMDRLAAELAALDKTDKLTAVTKLADFLKTPTS